MCGIYGVIAREAPISGAALAAMDRATFHRGPDDTGTLLDGECALGMRRLSIIDVAGGRQPIPSEDRTIWVVCNGEIYNHRELRADLRARGHKFSTGSDVEVIAHLYEDLGDRFCSKLRGMFACAVWDRRTRTLTLARDRLGIKPLFFAETPDGLVFASEMKGMLAWPSLRREIDPASLAHYLTFGTTPDGESILRGVHKLRPGHLLRYQKGRVTEERWWDYRDAFAGGPLKISDGEAVERTRALLSDAVRSHLVSDVPVGAFLSGGVDSATVVALMASFGPSPRTFSIGFNEPRFDELSWAKLCAERFGTQHEALVVRPDALALLDELIPALDEPFADSSALPTWLVSRLAAKHVKVVLSGDGGDEIFGGYTHYAHALAEARRLDRLPLAFRTMMARVAGVLPEVALGKNWLHHASLAPSLRFLDGSSLFPGPFRARLLSKDLAQVPDPLAERARILDGAPGDALQRLLYLDGITYLPLDILTKVDRMSMAHSLEVRPPLLDTPLVEAMARMPSRLKVARGAQKILLKTAMRDLLPSPILGRKKQGFAVPLVAWLRGPLRDLMRSLLSDGRTRARGLFDPRVVDQVVAEHLRGRRDRSQQIWSLLVLELWQRRFLDGSAADTAREAQIG
jgi:asparagine synthase (glutamine-hydrolysing)